MRTAPAVAPALAGAWTDDDADREAAALADTWREEHGARTARVFAGTDSEGTMLLAEFDDRQQAERAAVAGSGSSGQVHSFVHGMSNLAGTSGRLDGTPFLFVVRVFTPGEWVEPLRAWLHGEHFGRQVRTPGLVWARGYESEGSPFHFLNIWGLERSDVPRSQDYTEIRDTPWFASVGPAFAASDVRRGVYRPMTLQGDPV